MDKFLEQFKDKIVDISFGTSTTVRGKVISIDEKILKLRDEDERVAYVVIEKISIIWEAEDAQIRPGFVI